jgi:hypothetical protein
MNQDVVLFDPRPAVAWLDDRQRGQYMGGQRHFEGENPPRGTAIGYYLKSATNGVKISIADGSGKVVRTIDGTGKAGINRVMWNMAPNPPEGAGGGRQGGGGGGGGRGGGVGALPPGTYVVTLEAGGKKLTKPVTILEDVWLREDR